MTNYNSIRSGVRFCFFDDDGQRTAPYIKISSLEYESITTGRRYTTTDRMLDGNTVTVVASPKGLRFKVLGEAHNGEWTDSFRDNNNEVHVITRSLAWRRLGGEQFDFDCTCGWKGSNPYVGKSNSEANKHVARVLNNKGAQS